MVKRGSATNLWLVGIFLFSRPIPLCWCKLNSDKRLLRICFGSRGLPLLLTIKKEIKNSTCSSFSIVQLIKVWFLSLQGQSASNNNKRIQNSTFLLFNNSLRINWLWPILEAMTINKNFWNFHNKCKKQLKVSDTS